MTELDVVIEEVKQLARNGAAPGKTRFCKLTGYCEWEWEKYGLNWSQVVERAGFPANEFRLTRKYEVEELMSRLAMLIRNLGRFPTRIDFHRARREDPSCPSLLTFQKLGRKRALANVTLAYCRSRPGWDDVARVCEEYLRTSVPREALRHEEETGPAETRKKKIENVYLMKSGGFYKIGRSKSAKHRRRLVGLEMPEEVLLIHTIRTDDAIGIERYWHQRFAEKRLNGEWFKLDRWDIAEFKRRKFM